MSDRDRSSHETRRELGLERPDWGGASASQGRVGVTRFFRDEEVWDAVAARILPAITVQKQPRDPIRIWVPGCSTGEEAYSFAMLLAEQLGDKLAHYPIRIFATDSNPAAVDRARRGLFSKAVAEEVSSQRLQRFFHEHAHEPGYEISRGVRTLILFAVHDVTVDAPFSRLDLVSCRNLFIYLAPAAQKTALEAFHRALLPSGFLLLGGAETASELPEPFSPLDARLKIYARSARARAGRRQALPAMARDEVPAPSRGRPATPAVPKTVYAPGASYDIREVHRHMLETIEGLECANEELQSTVEQLQCANEELAVTNDELHAARDALQLANDELSSTVDELGIRSEELRHARDDVHNILNAVDAGVVLIGLDGRIRQFNRRASDLCGLGPAEVGLPLARLARPLGPQRLEAIVWRVVDQLVPFDEEVDAIDGTRYALRVIPYRTERAIRGAVVSLAKLSVDAREAELPLASGGMGSEPS